LKINYNHNLELGADHKKEGETRKNNLGEDELVAARRKENI
jgi:hypothetical protein